MKILVTGGCGFIGSHLADRLVADGHSVTLLDNLSTGLRRNAPRQARVVEGDVADGRMVDPLVSVADAVFHLAAIASVPICEQDPEMADRTNVLGARRVFEAAAAKKIPVIYASSAAVYGDNPALPLAETAAVQPLSTYGRAKLANEHQAAALWASHRLPSAGLRFFNVYGPRQDPRSPYSGVISKFMANAMGGEPLTFFGDGEQTRDFIYVGDVVDLMLAAWHHLSPIIGKGALVFNGCTGQAISLKQLAATIGETADKRIVARHAAARTGDIHHSLGDPQKAQNLLDFYAKTGLSQGLAALVKDGDA